MKKWFIFFAIAGLLISCAVHNNMYAWSDYKEVLARYTEKPNNNNKIALEESLLRVISASVLEKKRVPPGIYLQYGYLIASDGKQEIASQYYQFEKSTYPESTLLINELESKLK
jgi:hypothetical protein